MFQGLFGNASEVDSKEIQKDLSNILIEGETMIRGFKVLRDLFIFTDKRLVLVDKQGISGKKVEYHSIPYRSISHFSLETAGTFDFDSELKIYISGNPVPYQREFKKGSDVLGVQKMLAQCVLK